MSTGNPPPPHPYHSPAVAPLAKWTFRSPTLLVFVAFGDRKSPCQLQTCLYTMSDIDCGGCKTKIKIVNCGGHLHGGKEGFLFEHHLRKNIQAAGWLISKYVAGVRPTAGSKLVVSRSKGSHSLTFFTMENKNNVADYESQVFLV